MQLILLKHLPQFPEMFDNQIRLRRAQLLQRVVAGKNCT
jgi:hypothetical protein